MFLTDRFQTERRDHLRMNVDCDIKCKEMETKKFFSGKGKNLSSKGILFETSHQTQLGTELEIQIKPATDMIPPLTARGTITRCQPIDETNNRYEISMQIDELLN